jgi:glycosyltransferase involved in cell wall biosynthesis
LPTISIVTPSFNQAPFLEDTIRSVLSSTYPSLQYVVIDGGSTDGSVDVIRRYEDRLTSWVSEPDDGQYHAITKGFARTDGELMGWLNSDDLYLPWTLRHVGEVFADLPEVRWLTSTVSIHCDEDLRIRRWHTMADHSRRKFRSGVTIPGFGDPIVQEATFWRRDLWDEVGSSVGTGYGLAGDFDLWGRFFRVADLHCVNVPLAIVRIHPSRRSSLLIDRYVEECFASLHQNGGKPWAKPMLGARKIARIGAAVISRNLPPRGHKVVYDWRREKWRVRKPLK